MDYRLTEYDIFDWDRLPIAKQSLSNRIDERVREKEHIGEHYGKISDKSGAYYQDFERIYEFKCAYCGITTSINSTNMFEIDHFVNKTQKKLANGKSVNSIENLIFSCRKCNQAKSELDVSTICNIIHPDGGISDVFERNNKYEIIINEGYIRDPDVLRFYNKLGLSDKFRKLDYLLMNLQKMKEISTNEKLTGLIYKLYADLLEMRNRSI